MDLTAISRNCSLVDIGREEALRAQALDAVPPQAEVEVGLGGRELSQRCSSADRGMLVI